MAGNTFGKLFRVTTAGVSHGPGYLCIIDGCPAGLELSVADLLPDLARRRPGQSKLTTQRGRGRYSRDLVGRVRGPHGRHAHRHFVPQRRPAQRRLRRHQGQVPPRPRRLHLRRQVWLSRLSRRRPVERARVALPRRGRRGREETPRPLRHPGRGLRHAGREREGGDRRSFIASHSNRWRPHRFAVPIRPPRPR